MINANSTNRRGFLKKSAAAALAASLVGQFPSMGETKGKRIGFVDFDLDNFHANVFLKALRGPLASRGFTVAGGTGIKKEPSRAWAEKNAVPYFESVEALNAAVDFFMILAPSNPEVHLDLCRQVLPFGKPTYVDKTFAPDVATAKEIFAIADKNQAAVQTSSSLRYTNVQDEVRKSAPAQVEHMITWGGGGSFAEYAIHPTELLISVMGPEVTGLMRRGAPERSQLLVEFARGRTGVINVFANTNTPFAASFTTEKTTRYLEVDASKIFVNNQAAILDFFKSGKPNVDRCETLAVMWILETARDPRAWKEFVRPKIARKASS